MSDNLKSLPEENIEKIKVSNAEIVVRGTKEKPYFEIKYFDLSDNETHIGYSSYNLDIVFGYLDKYFDIVEKDERGDDYPYNDLISRKAFIKYMHDNFKQTPQIVAFIGIIAEQPAAFDREKVIDIIARANSAITVNDTERALYWMKKLEEIVEKGGIE